MPQSPPRPQPKLVHIEDLEWKTGGNGGALEHQRKLLAQAAGGVALGCSLFQVPVGKAAFPMHKHYANEEALYILQGQAELRLNDARHLVSKGDYVALPAASGKAHQLLNTGSGPVVYLCMSTMIFPDIVEQPTSNKVGVFAKAAPGAPTDPQDTRAFFLKKASVGYFDKK